MRAEGMDPDLGDIIVTTGGQQAIDLVADGFPGRLVRGLPGHLAQQLCDAQQHVRAGAAEAPRLRDRTVQQVGEFRAAEHDADASLLVAQQPRTELEVERVAEHAGDVTECVDRGRGVVDPW